MAEVAPPVVGLIDAADPPAVWARAALASPKPTPAVDRFSVADRSLSVFAEPCGMAGSKPDSIEQTD
jgi:hypothetical protein